MRVGNLKVQKKDGSLEDFDRGKIARAVTAAGALPEQAESIAGQAETWAQGAAVKMVSSQELKGKVLEILRGVNPTAASAFEAYRKTT